MNIYIIIIVLLLAAVTFLGFKPAQAPEQDSPGVNVTEGSVEREDSVDIIQEDIPETEVQDVIAPKITGKTIDLSGTGLVKVPGSVFDTVSLVTLDVSNNILNGALQSEVRHLQELKVLNLSNNNFTGVPAEIGQLQKLEILNLSGNPITGLPLELGNLRSLRVLDLRDTQYSQYDLDIIKKTLPAGVEIKT